MHLWQMIFVTTQQSSKRQEYPPERREYLAKIRADQYLYSMELELASHRPYGEIRPSQMGILKGDSHLRLVAVDSSDKLLIKADV